MLIDVGAYRRWVVMKRLSKFVGTFRENGNGVGSKDLWSIKLV